MRISVSDEPMKFIARLMDWRKNIMGSNAALALNDKEEHAVTLPNRTAFFMTLVKVTPEIATEWLGRNRVNRVITKSKVKQYQSDMEQGKWAGIGDPIRFTKTGRLMDGQHRLLALVAAGVKIQFVVMVGLSDEDFDKVDTGKPRQAGDVLSIEGLGPWQARIAGTAAHWVIGKAQGRPLHSTTKSSNHVVRSFLLDNPKFVKSVECVEQLPRRNPPMSHSLAAALHWQFSRIDAALADQFMNGLFIGDNLRKDSPVLALRNKLTETRLLRNNTNRSYAGYSTRQQMHAAIKAWNILRRGKSCTSARSLFPRSDDEFPEAE